MARSTKLTRAAARHCNYVIERTAAQAISLASHRKSAAQRRADLDGSLKTSAACLAAAWNLDPHALLKRLEAAAAKRA